MSLFSCLIRVCSFMWAIVYGLFRCYRVPFMSSRSPNDTEPTGQAEEKDPLLLKEGGSSTELESNSPPLAPTSNTPPASTPSCAEFMSDKESQLSASNKASKNEQPKNVCSSLSRSQSTPSKKINQDRKYWESLPLEEKRKQYTCRQYVTLENIKPWSQEKTVPPKKKTKAPTRSFPDVDSFPVNQSLNNKVSLWCGDITSLEIDAIVNAANSSLMGGGGVDGAIHRAASRSLKRECSELMGCDAGDAKVTGGHQLPAKYIIHTVGPMDRSRPTLENCYSNCLKRVEENKIQSVAFCCISTGIYGYPNEEAAHVALGTVRKWLEANSDKVERIIFCVFLDKDLKIYRRLLHLYFPCEQMEAENEKSEEQMEVANEKSEKQMEAANKDSDVDMSEDDDTPPSSQDDHKPPPLKRNQTEPVGSSNVDPQ